MGQSKNFKIQKMSNNPVLVIIEVLYILLCFVGNMFKSLFTYLTSPKKYPYSSKFIRHCVAYDIVELNYAQAEILDRTGYHTHIDCRSLADDFGINKLRQELANVCNNLSKGQKITEKDFEFNFLTIKKYKAIGQYARRKDSSYFSQMDENGMIVPKTTAPKNKGRQVSEKL